MAKKIVVERWLDEEENEHTTQASADYEDCRRRLTRTLGNYDSRLDGDDVVEFIAANIEDVRRFIAATLTFKAEGGRKLVAPF